MSKNLCDSNITVAFNCQFEVELADAKLITILTSFCSYLPELLREFVQKILTGFAEQAMKMEKKPFSCDKCSNDGNFIWKSRHGKQTKILTVFNWLTLQQLQVQCKKCGHKFYITRKLLDLAPKKRIPDETCRKLGLLGSLTSFRVAEKVTTMFGWTIDKMTIWRSVQKTAKEIEFKLDGEELPRGEADGTGIPINGIKKRGKELKVFVQYKKTGGIRVAGLDVGDYHGGWESLFSNSLNVFKEFKQKFLLVTDGDTSILDGLKDKVEILVQRCLWHIPHQAKYVLWKDKVKSKSESWLYVLAELLEICAIRPLVDCEETIQAMIASKSERLEKIIGYCQKNGYAHTAEYLENAHADMFTAITNRLHGKTTSRVERLMKTVNMRINVGKWSVSGALNTTKIRLAYYYNGFDA
jgi:hypothetical protein